MICDLIISWPTNCDYPLWRQYIRDHRANINELIIAFTQANLGDDYRNFIKLSMYQDYTHTLDAPTPKPGDDWRNLAINAALLHSYNSPWLWFTEQDFYPEPGFWDEVARLEATGAGVIGVYQGTRLHPCCLFIKREVLENTRRDFSITPDFADHFYKLQLDLANAGVTISTIDPKYYYHYNGLSHNWRLVNEGQKPNYHPAEFIKWLENCLKVAVPLDKRFINVAVNVQFLHK